MPLCTIHLLSLPRTPTALSTFLTALKSSNVRPLVTSRIIRWIILPTTLSTTPLLSQNIKWDILLILPSTGPLPTDLQRLIEHEWRITAGVPSRLVNDFAATNAKLLHPESTDVPPLDPHPRTKAELTKSSQDLELSAELNSWVDSFLSQSPGRQANGAVSMLNLLKFQPGMKSEYLKYGKAFAEDVGRRFGGVAKIVGNIVPVGAAGAAGAAGSAGGLARGAAGVDAAGVNAEAEDTEGWDEMALAHYPSIAHFRAMLSSPDYQAANQEFRIGSLGDTCILMTSEVGIEDLWEGRARL